MLRTIQEITITGAKADSKFKFCQSVEIQSSRNKFTDTAMVMIPQRDKNFSQYIQVNDKIEIKLGYFKTGLKTEFVGYIKSITPDSVMILECEDEAWLYKQTTIENKIFRNVNLVDLITYYYKGEVDVLNTNIGTWKIGKNSTFITLLNEINQVLEFRSYWQNGILYVGKKKEADKQIIFNSNQNVIEGSDNLEISNNVDFTAVVHGISPQPNGNTTELYCYYKDPASKTDIVVTSDKPNGTLNELKIPNLTKSELDDLCRNRLPIISYNGLSGDIRTLGAPTFQHGDEAKIVNQDQPDKNGIYEIAETVKSFSSDNAYIQTAVLGELLRDS